MNNPTRTSRFDHLSSDNNRVNPPSEEEIVPEEEKDNHVRAELVPLRNSAPSQMTLSVQDAARADGILYKHSYLYFQTIFLKLSLKNFISQ